MKKIILTSVFTISWLVAISQQKPTVKQYLVFNNQDKSVRVTFLLYGKYYTHKLYSRSGAIFHSEVPVVVTTSKKYYQVLNCTEKQAASNCDCIVQKQETQVASVVK